MAGLTRVPAPDPSFYGRAGAAGVVLLVMIAALAIEPWGQAAVPTASASPPRWELRSARPPMSVDGIAGLGAAAPGEVRTYQSSAFGAPPSDEGWSIRTGARALPLTLAGPTDDVLAVATGPVVELGAADELGGVVITGPTGATVDVVRLWRFEPGRDPERLELRMLPSPWPIDHVWAIGLRVPGASPLQIGAWRPGRYRLDLLIGRDEAPRAVILVVGAGGAASSEPAALGQPRGTPPAPFRPTLLDRLPSAANVWAFGSILSGWARPPSRDDCRLAEVWRPDDSQGGCRAVQSGPTTALGVNLPAGQRVTGISLSRMDPTSTGIVLDSDIGVGGRPGLAALRTESGHPLGDGIYRMKVTVANGTDLHWYIEVGPEGRRAAAINAFVTGYQR